jgi:hypothetical protein
LSLDAPLSLDAAATLDAASIQRYQRQLLLAPIGGAGQLAMASATVLLHGDAALCATYLAAAGLGCLRYTGSTPKLGAHDPDFRLERGVVGEDVDFTLDLGDGTAFHMATGARLWGGVVDGELRLDCRPDERAVFDHPLFAVLQPLAAGEALWRILGHPTHEFRFSRS